MSIRLLTASAVALGLVAFIPAAKAQDAATVQQAIVVRDAAMRSNIAMDYVTQLTTRFGARPAGSRSEQQAAAWAADYLRANGFQNVRIEEFPLVGGERGESGSSRARPGCCPRRKRWAGLHCRRRRRPAAPGRCSRCRGGRPR